MSFFEAVKTFSPNRNARVLQKKQSVEDNKIIKAKIGRADTMYRFDPRVHMDLSEIDLICLNQYERLSKISWFKEATKLTPGQTFGEQALFYEKPRKARAYCISECYFATLNKQIFRRVLTQIEMRK